MEDAIVWEPVWRQEYVAVTRQYGFGTDAMLLADFAAPRSGERVVELGTGCGAIALRLCATGKPGCAAGRRGRFPARRCPPFPWGIGGSPAAWGTPAQRGWWCVIRPISRRIPGRCLRRSPGGRRAMPLPIRWRRFALPPAGCCKTAGAFACATDRSI